MRKSIIAVLLFSACVLFAWADAEAGELHDAVYNNDIAKVRQLLENGADIGAQNNDQATPLHYAAAYGRTEVAKLLIENGADINAQTNDQKTPLYYAVYNGMTEVAKLLIEKGADINAKDKEQNTFLHKAAEENKTELAKLLIEHGADVNALNKNQETPLHINAMRLIGGTEVAKLLIEKGADINAKDNEQDTPLHKAAEKGTEVVKLLIEKGADVNALNKNQETPLHIAIGMRRTEVAKLLIEKGADVNVKNQFQETPLHWAADYGYSELAKLLIENGADINVKDQFQETPLNHASKRNKIEIVKLLTERGAATQEISEWVKKLNGVTYSNDPRYMPVNYNHDLQYIVMLSRSITPPPTIPQEAKDEMVKGQAAFKLAKRVEDYIEAEKHFNKASLLAPWLPAPYYNNAIALEKQHKFIAARVNYQRYLIAAPDAKDAEAVKVKIAEMELQFDRWQEFEQAANAGVEAFNKGPNSYNEAIKLWKTAIELCPEPSYLDQVYFNIGEVYLKKDDLDEAYKYMQKSLELNPDVAGRNNNMGVVLDRRGDRAKACTYYKKACDLGSKTACDNKIGCP